MYNTRLKQWNICKNYRAEEKELLAARIAQAHLENRSIDNLTFKDRPVKLDRVLRHCRTRRRESTHPKTNLQDRRRIVPVDGEESSDSFVEVPVQDNMVRYLSSTQANDSDASDQSISIPIQSTSRNKPTITPGSGNTTTSVLTPSSSDPNENDDSFEIINHDDLTIEVLSADPPLFP